MMAARSFLVTPRAREQYERYREARNRLWPRPPLVFKRPWSTPKIVPVPMLFTEEQRIIEIISCCAGVRKPEMIREIAADIFGIPSEIMQSASRRARWTRPRMITIAIACHLLRDHPAYSRNFIARHFGGRHESSINYAEKRYGHLIENALAKIAAAIQSLPSDHNTQTKGET